jgi:PAS domain S-box-containing protein
VTDDAVLSPAVRSSPAFAWPGLGQIALFYLLCLLAAGYAELLATIPGTGISIWLPSGLLLGALLVNPRRTWLWWIATASVAELTGEALWFGNGYPGALFFVLGNAAESVIGAYLIGRLVSWPYRMEVLRDVLGLVLLGTILAPLVAALVGGLTLAWQADLPAAEATALFWRSFWLLWIGDATGVLIAAPAVAVVVDFWRRGKLPTITRWPEAAAMAVGAALVAAASLSGQLPFGLIIIPLILLAAVRFHFWGSILSSAAITLLAAAFQLSAVNPFVLVGSELESHVQLQVFLAISAFSTLVVAALARQNERVLLSLLEANRDLEQRVLDRTASLTESEGRLKRVLETAQVGVAFANDKAMITHANEALGRLVGRSVLELRGGTVSWRALLPESERLKFNHELGRLTAEGKAGPVELTLVRPDGAKVQSLFAASRLDDGEVVAFIVDQREQKQHEEHVVLLMRELNHRAKNTLTLVLAIARQTRAASAPEFLARFSERIQAMAALQDLLVANMWKGAPLESIIREQLAHLRDALDTRIAISGPPVVLTPSAAQTIGLAVHELATNSGKYGALSNDAGRIAISWTHRPDNKVRMSWTESGGPLVKEPETKGFGTTVVSAMVKGSLGCDVDIAYEPAGLKWSLECPLDRLTTVGGEDTGQSA